MRKILLLLAVVLISQTAFESCWFLSDANRTAKKEFAPSAMLKKYEWFKDASAMLIKKEQDIQIYTDNIDDMISIYEGVSRKDWDRTDKEQMNQWRTELAGVKASYTALAAEYNSQSSKFNWKHFEGEEPLQKKFSKYLN